MAHDRRLFSKKVALILLSLIFSPVVLIGLILFLIFPVTPLLLIRCLVSLVKSGGGEGHRLLSPLSAFFAADKMYQDHPLSTNLVCITVDGLMDIDKCRQSLIQNVLDKKKQGISGQLKYPELRMRVKWWGGFPFWEEDKNFMVDNHFRQVKFEGTEEDQPITQELYVPMLKNLLKIPFDPQKSPWEIIVLHNYKDKRDTSYIPKTLIVYRLHHALCGGYSSMQLIVDHGAIPVTRATPSYPKIPTWKKVIWHLFFIFRAPFELLYDSLSSFDVNEWKLPARKLTREKSAALSPLIPVESIKEIKNAHGTSFSAVISAAIAGGVRSYMMENGIKVPHSISVMTPWPVKMIPEKLGNFMSGVIIDYPIGVEDPKQRLMEIDKNFMGMKFSTLPITYFHLLKIMGRLPYFILSHARKHLPTTTVMSNIAGPNERLISLDHVISDIYFVANFMVDNIAFGFTVLSYNGFLKIVCGADTTILPSDVKADELMEKILEQFKILRDQQVSIV